MLGIFFLILIIGESIAINWKKFLMKKLNITLANPGMLKRSSLYEEYGTCDMVWYMHYGRVMLKLQ